MEFMRKIGLGCLLCFKAVIWLLLGMVKIIVEVVKVVLLAFSLILRIFTCFFKAGTP